MEPLLQDSPADEDLSRLQPLESHYYTEVERWVENDPACLLVLHFNIPEQDVAVEERIPEQDVAVEERLLRHMNDAVVSVCRA